MSANIWASETTVAAPRLAAPIGKIGDLAPGRVG